MVWHSRDCNTPKDFQSISPLICSSFIQSMKQASLGALATENIFGREMKPLCIWCPMSTWTCSRKWLSLSSKMQSIKLSSVWERKECIWHSLTFMWIYWWLKALVMEVLPQFNLQGNHHLQTFQEETLQSHVAYSGSMLKYIYQYADYILIMHVTSNAYITDPDVIWIHIIQIQDH